MIDFVQRLRFLFLPKLLKNAIRTSRKRPVDISRIRSYIEKYCSGTDFSSYFSQFEKVYSVLQGNRTKELNCNNLILSSVREIGRIDIVKAIHFGEQFPPRESDSRFDKTIAEYYYKNGQPLMALNHLNLIPDTTAVGELRERVEASLEADNYGLNDIPPFIKHKSEVILTSASYSLYLPSQHFDLEDSNGIAQLNGAMALPKDAPLNSALITIKFYNTNGDELSFNANSLLKESSIVGPYQYVNPDEDGTFSVMFKPPQDFEYALISFRCWKNVTGIRLGSVLELSTSVEYSYVETIFNKFSKASQLYSRKMFFVYGCSTNDPSKSIERPSQLLFNFSKSKYSTINGYSRKNRKKHPKNTTLGSNINIPLDILNPLLPQISKRDFEGVMKNLYISCTTPSIIRNIHHFNSENWIVICDLHTWKIDMDVGFTLGQAHLLANSDVIIAENSAQEHLVNQLRIENKNIFIGATGWIDSNLQKSVRNTKSRTIGILQREDEDTDFDLVANVARGMPEYNFELLGSNWPKDIEKPLNIKSWTIRGSKWLVQRMLTWNLAFDSPLSTKKGMPAGLHELVNNRIPCILPANEMNTDVIPYVIRCHNVTQIQSAIQEAIMMDRTYSPRIDARDWKYVVAELDEVLSQVQSFKKNHSVFNYLPMAELITLAEQKPPQIDEIKNKVKDAFQSQGISVYRDLNWSLDYLCFNNNLAKSIANNLLIGSIRGIGAVDPYTAIQLAESFDFEDDRYARTMITFYNDTEQFRKSMTLLRSMKNSTWKTKMTRFLEPKLLSGIPNKQRTGFFEILPQKKESVSKRELNVVCVLDKFSFDSLSFEMNLHPLPKSGWKEFLDKGDFDFFLAESIWKGHDEQWIWAMSSPDSPNGERLKEVLEYCKEINLKKIFWNKEDPVNYDRFITTAKRFDVIFTSDNRSIPRYVEDCGHENIHAMAFACQPIIHNPVRNKLPIHSICFAGSWYVREHGDRKRQTKLLVDASKKDGIHIYDRFYGTNDANRFPSSYSRFVRGSMPYEECCMAYRAYKLFLNVNSVMNSDTMFSRRVFEILASSTHVLSTPSEGMENMLPFGVTVVDSLNDAQQAITHLLANDEERNKSAHLGYRHVMNNHTYSHRVGDMLDKLGIQSEIPLNNPLVSLVTCTNRPDMISNIMHNFNHQTWKNKEIIIVIDCGDQDYREVKKVLGNQGNITLHKVQIGLSLGHCFNKGMELSKGDYIAKFDDDDLYGPNYIEDQLLPFKYTDADIVGKLCTFMYHEKSERTYLRFPNNRHKFGDLVLGPTFFFKRKVADNIKMRDLSRSEDTNFLKDSIEAGYKIYATDPYNFVYNRKKVEGFHTWDATDEQLLKNAVELGSKPPEEYAFI
jgi:spore maturation protein CgeB